MSSSKNEDILGVYSGHDATVVLMRNGVILEAMSEERLSRIKKHSGFPHLSLEHIHKKYHLHLNEIFVIQSGTQTLPGFLSTLDENAHERNQAKPRKWFQRSVLMFIPATSFLLRLRDTYVNWRQTIGSSGKYDSLLRAKFPNVHVTKIDHHDAHAWAAVAFMPRDNKSRLVLTLDGEGDGTSGSINVFENGVMSRKHVFASNQSLGLLYCAIVDILGMKRNEHEFKVMGLAPYAKASAGEKVYQELRSFIWFNKETLQIETLFDMHNATTELIKRDFTTRYRFDSLAYGIQKLTEKLIKEIALSAISRYGVSDIALGGGVFMNVKANQYLAALPEVSSVIVTPSCGDESLALGAVVAQYSELHNGDLTGMPPLTNIYLGSEFNDESIKQALDSYTAKNEWKIEYINPNGQVTIEQKVAELLSQNSVVGRFKGRAEWGARALGNRSILANPKSRDNVKLINEMIKGRDFWMPFATSILYERRHDYLVNPSDMHAPHMAITFETTPLAQTEIVAALHPYDLTSRPQIVQKEINPEYHQVISEFQTITGIGGILNTSFNLHGEPNVENPIDALRTFDHSGLPHLAIGNYLCSKLS